MAELEVLFSDHLHALIPNAGKCRFLLAVSGGRDSTVLAHLFLHTELDFAIAHCNFHLRADDSNSDENFVRELAQKFRKTLYVKQFDTNKVQENSGMSIEMVARELRYTWFNEIGKDFDYIVTAHHANDNAETLLLNLSRGTGLKGLTGIPEKNGKILRPLLPFTSQQIQHYADEKNIAFRTDITNFSEQYNRNKIRLKVLPALAKANPEIILTLCQNIAHFKQQYSFYTNEIQKFKSSITFTKDDYLYISISKLSVEEDAGLLLYEFLKPYNFSAETVQEIFAVMQAEPGRVFHSTTHELLKDRDTLIVRPSNSVTSFEFICNNEKELQNLGFEIELLSIKNKPHFSKNQNIIFIDADKFHFPVAVRSWRDGDIFQPFGLKGRQKLSDFFNNEKVNRFEKQRVPILCIDNQIVWVVGYRADDHFKIDEHTQYYYKLLYHGRI